VHAWKKQQAVQIGRNIRERRKQLGLTQSDLAQGLFSVQSISLIERGKLKINPETLATLASRLRCEVDDLLLMHDLQEDWLDELLRTAQVHQDAHQISQAIEIFHQLYSEALAKNNIGYMLESSYHLCLLYNQSSKPTISTEWGQIALHFLDSGEAIDRILTIYTTLGNNYYTLGQMWEAFDLLREAEKRVDPNLNSSEQAGRLYYSMAIIKMMLENWEGCIWYSERALPIFEQHDLLLYIGRTHMMLGLAYKGQKRYKKSLHSLERSIRILSQTSDLASLARCYHNLGELEYELGHLDRARKNYLRSLKLKRQTQDTDSQLITLRMLARLSIEEDRLDEARHFLKESLDRAQKLGSPLQLAKTWQHLGELALVEGNEDEYISYSKRAIDQYDDLGFSTNLAETAEKLGDFYLKRGQDRLAVPYLQTAIRHYRKLLTKS